ncbi:Transcription factor hamlet [Porphyridium purpureum]|uniref:Transcription factor hamlet n=1 Tax=Porphyridium purpureum TaxID=35688 RepID=A0A5J4Z275_PORPP|nr:Transcription factor hamlet [Porphyridium purpureum]|eukprot:POR3222..scf208_2
MTMAPGSFQSVLRVVLEEEQVNAWIVRWLQACVRPSSNAEAARPRLTPEHAPAADIEVRHSFDGQIAPEEMACLPYMPQQGDLDSAVIWDYDIRYINSTSCGVIIPFCDGLQQSRFVHAVMMTNTNTVVVPQGVHFFPGYRLTGFRTRYGFAYITAGSCSDGSILLQLMRFWDNGRLKGEFWRIANFERDATVSSYSVLERAGECVQNCLTGSCTCWRVPASRRTDAELARAYDWNDFSAAVRRGLCAPQLKSPEMVLEGFLGSGQLAFRSVTNSGFQSSLGSEYTNMKHLQFLFFDRLTTASSVWHSRAITWKGDALFHKANASRKRAKRSFDSRTDSGSETGMVCESDPARVESSAGHCTKCDKVFSRSRDLKRHIRTVHEGDQPYACERCLRKFAQLSHLRVHVLGVHEKRRDFQCTSCEATFSVLSNWKRHIRNVHPNLHID